jgi:hypothetical protein
MPIADYLSQWIPALDAEIATASRRGGERYPLHSGQALGVSGGRFLYRFRPSRQCTVPDDAEVVVESGDQQIDGRLISSDDEEIVVALVEPLERVGRATLIVRLWFILEQLRDRLQAPNRAGSKLFDGARPGAGISPGTNLRAGQDPPYAGLNAEQSHAVRVGQQPGIWFVWGPPGTGKTRTLGRLAAQAAADGRKVLFLTFSNDALDVAALRVLDDAPVELRRPGAVLRLGYPRRAEVRDHPTLTPLAALRQIKPELVARYDAAASALEGARRDHVTGAALVRLRDELRAQRDDLRKAMDGLALRANVLLCTLARLATSDLLDSQKYDTVIVDEASMVGAPYAGFASTYATGSVVYAGDFRQLPPVVLTNDQAARSTLMESVFDHAGVSRQGAAHDARLVALAEQYRMAEPIAERVSNVFYGGRLRTAPSVGMRPTDCAMVVDIGAFAPYSQPEASDYGTSRFNIVSALLSLALARQAAHVFGGDIGIITPFRAQATLIRGLAQDRGLDWLRVATVHRYQGDEADAIILDLATARGHTRLGHLLGGDPSSQAGRLVNVAISRAKRNLFVVADWRHLENRWFAKAAGYENEALYRVLEGLPRVRLDLDDVGGIQDLSAPISPFRAPRVPLADGEWLDGPAPPSTWPVMLRKGSVFKGLAAQQVTLPSRQLLLAVRSESRPAEWVQRAHDGGVEVIVRGKGLHQEWARRLPGARFIEADAPVDSVVLDGERFAATFGDPTSGTVYTLEIVSPRAAPFIADFAGLQTLGGKIVRQPFPPPPHDPSPTGPTSPVPAPVEEIPEAEIVEETVQPSPIVDVPPRCPVSDHRLILYIWPQPVRLGCEDKSCEFNVGEAAEGALPAPNPFGLPPARILSERQAYAILAGLGLACGCHDVLPVGANSGAGLVYACPQEGCNWRGRSSSPAVYI